METTRSQLSAVRRPLFYVLSLYGLSGFYGLVGIYGLVGCSGPPLVLEFPDSEHFVPSSVVKSGVNIVLEVEDRPEEEFLRPSVSQKNAATHLDFGSGHEIQVRYQLFHVGEARYPAAQSTLFVFLPRTGPWRFRYRGHDVTIEREGTWKPSVYFRQVDKSVVGRDASGQALPFELRRRRTHGLSVSEAQKQIDHEEIRVLENKIVFRPEHDASAEAPTVRLDSGSWEINGQNVPVSLGEAIVIREDGTIGRDR